MSDRDQARAKETWRKRQSGSPRMDLRETHEARSARAFSDFELAISRQARFRVSAK